MTGLSKFCSSVTAVAALMVLLGSQNGSGRGTGRLVGDFTPCSGPPSGSTDAVGRGRALLAHSTNGVDWERPTNLNDAILVDRAGVPDAVVLPSGRILVYFVDGCRPADETQTDRSGVSVAVSDEKGAPDSWVFKNVRFTNIPEQFGPFPVDPNVVLMPDGSLRLFTTMFPLGSTGMATNSFSSTDGGFTFAFEGERYAEIADPENYRFTDANWQILTGGPKGHALSTDGGNTFQNLGFFRSNDYEGVVHEIAVTENTGEYRAYVSMSTVIKSLLSTADPWTSWTEEAGYRLQVNSTTGLESCELSFPTVVKLGPSDYLMVYLTVFPGCTCGDPSLCTPVPATVTLTRSGSGRGTVTAASTTLNCGTSCVATFNSGTSLRLVPTPEPDSTFAGFTGDADCTDGVLTLTASRTCNAMFVHQTDGGRVMLNGDGTADAFTYDATSGRWSIETASSVRSFSSKGGSWSPGWTIRAGDFNGDGLTDFFLYDPVSGAWFKATSNGQGDFTYFGSTWGGKWNTLVTDLNGDGLSDVFLYKPLTGTWFKCFTAGSGEFFYYTGTWSSNWQVYAAELNGDRRADLLLYNGTSGQWFWALNEADASFSYVSGSWSPNWRLYPGDFNGDGRSDAFLYDTTTGQWFICTNTGTGFAYSSSTWSPGWTVRLGDFNGDGKTDVFVYNEITGQWVEAINSGGTDFTYYAGTWSPSWQIFVTDFDGDQWADLLLYNSTTTTWVQCVNTAVGAFQYYSGTWQAGLSIVASATRVP